MTEEKEDHEEKSKQANPDATQLGQVNRSGFPFQIGVEDEIRRLGQRHEPWTVVGTEIPWDGGFIDVVARRHEAIAVLECKRVDEQDWIFLVPSNASKTIRATWNFYDSRAGIPGSTGMYFGEFTLAADSHEASLCALSKKKNTGNVTLERTCQELIRASQAIADFPQLQHRTEIEIQIPIVVTTARLKVCRYNARQVDPAEGIIRPESAFFEEVPYIRFRKAFQSLAEARMTSPEPLENLAKSCQHTVLVCNGEGIASLLLQIEKKITLRDGRANQITEFY